MLLLNSLDHELLASRAVCTILLIIIAVGLLLNLIWIWKAKSKGWRVFRIVLTLALGAGSFPVVNKLLIDHNMLQNPRTTVGVTKGFCEVPLRGKGIRFQYKVDGEEYSNCNTFHPIPQDSIKVQSGRFIVRYAPGYESEGRMNFHEPVNENNHAADRKH